MEYYNNIGRALSRGLIRFNTHSIARWSFTAFCQVEKNNLPRITGKLPRIPGDVTARNSSAAVRR